MRTKTMQIEWPRVFVLGFMAFAIIACGGSEGPGETTINIPDFPDVTVTGDEAGATTVQNPPDTTTYEEGAFQFAGDEPVDVEVQGDDITVNVPSPLPGDRDGDGITDDVDVCPMMRGTPDDSDGEGLLDVREDELHTDKCKPDSDFDLFTDFEEVEIGTVPTDPDTDGDGFMDGRDICPLMAGTRFDSDSDGRNDGDDSEYCNPDTDGDGLVDGSDPNPTNSDTDGDGIKDGEDICPTGTYVVQSNATPDVGPFPTAEDQDGDSILNEHERTGVVVPVNGVEITFVLNPCSGDTDGDGYSDDFEVWTSWGVGANQPTVPADPTNPDIDGDGVLDGRDLCPATVGYRNDEDRDGVGNVNEWRRGADMCSPDTDGDGNGDWYDEYPSQADESVSRAEFALMVVAETGLAFGISMPANPLFTDVDQNAWYYESVQILADNGIIPNGGRFHPEEKISREDALEIAYRAIHRMYYYLAFPSPIQNDTPFIDMPLSLIPYYNGLEEEGYYGPNRSRLDPSGHEVFRPEDAATKPFVRDLLTVGDPPGYNPGWDDPAW